MVKPRSDDCDDRNNVDLTLAIASFRSTLVARRLKPIYFSLRLFSFLCASVVVVVFALEPKKVKAISFSAFDCNRKVFVCLVCAAILVVRFSSSLRLSFYCLQRSRIENY